MYKNKIREIKYNDVDYPQKLKNIKNPPQKIYVIGNLPDENKKTVAIVGARSASDYGMTVAKTISKKLSNENIQVISGLALGIDTSSHIGSIEVDKPNFAVLGCGVDICYPQYNYNIYEQIIKNGGGIISEFENGTPPLPYNFPKRNRIISGLSDIVIVVECKMNSGALITSDYALEQGKTIFAVPGRVMDSLSQGTNKLIKDGAYIFTEMQDIYEHLGIICDDKMDISGKDLTKLDYFELLIYNTLSDRSLHIDEIVMNVKLPIEKCLNTLMSLQINGLVESVSLNYYRRT